MAPSPKPILCVGAVVFKSRSALLIRRGKPPYQGQWSLPGGKVEYDESLHEAVAREVREETDITITDIELLEVYQSLPRLRRDQSPNHYVMVDFVASWAGGAPKAGDDAVEAAFFPLEEAIEKVSWDDTRTALRDAYQKRVAALK